jgi:uncharacterized protein involved in exopolysaccharide biosynthesis
MIKLGVPGKTTSAGVANGDSPERHLQTEAEGIVSESVLSNVATRLELPAEWGQRYAGSAKLTVDECVRILQATVKARPHPGAAILDITAYSHSPQEAADIANATIEAYMEFSGEHAPQMQVVVLQRATVAHKPVKPNKPSNVLIGALVALPITILGVVFTMIALRKWTTPPAMPG